MRLKKVQQDIAAFIHERKWDAYHTPKNIMLSLSVEVGELLSLAEWMDDDQLATALKEPDFSRAVRDEIADVLHHLLGLCNKLGIDPVDALNAKMENSRQRFPQGKSLDFDPVAWKLKKIR